MAQCRDLCLRRGAYGALSSPVMLVELLLVVTVTPPVVFAMGSAWTVVLIAEGAFFLFRSIAALLMDVRNRQEDITMFSTIETINVIPVGILYLDPRGRPLLMNRCMRKNLVELHMPTDPRRYERYMERPAQTQHANARKAARTVCGLIWTALVRRGRWSRFLPPRFACLCTMTLWFRAASLSALSA